MNLLLLFTFTFLFVVICGQKIDFFAAEAVEEAHVDTPSSSFLLAPPPDNEKEVTDGEVDDDESGKSDDSTTSVRGVDGNLAAGAAAAACSLPRAPLLHTADSYRKYMHELEISLNMCAQDSNLWSFVPVCTQKGDDGGGVGGGAAAALPVFSRPSTLTKFLIFGTGLPFSGIRNIKTALLYLNSELKFAYRPVYRFLRYLSGADVDFCSFFNEQTEDGMIDFNSASLFEELSFAFPHALFVHTPIGNETRWFNRIKRRQLRDVPLFKSNMIYIDDNELRGAQARLIRRAKAFSTVHANAQAWQPSAQRHDDRVRRHFHQQPHRLFVFTDEVLADDARAWRMACDLLRESGRGAEACDDGDAFAKLPRFPTCGFEVSVSNCLRQLI